MSRLTDIQIKLESNELQTYLDTFNKEIQEGNQSLNASLVDGGDMVSIRSKEDDEEEEEDEENGTYFVDQSGNYYYQPTKDSDPIPAEIPDELTEIQDESDDDETVQTDKIAVKASYGKRKNISTDASNRASKKSKSDEEDPKYVLVLGDGKYEDEENIESNEEEELEEDDDDDVKEVYEFDENDETSSKNSSFRVPPKVVNLKLKTKDGNNQTYQCVHCEYITTKRYLLARHMKCHSEDRPHKCAVCERGFKTNASLQNHANTHTGNKPHRCKQCESTFTTSGELVRHVRYKHTHEKPHKCTECDYASVELSKLKRHIRCHTGERPFQCPHCTYASPDTFKLKRHMRTHTGEKPYECEICHSKFTQSNSLKAHKLIHSVGDKPVFQCNLCPTTCGRKTDLRIHIQKLHTSERPITCKRCGKQFPDRYTYKVHSKTHEGEKCFRCEQCPYASISQRHLDSHLLIHTDQKPFHCKLCEQSFRQKQLLRRHINLYHNKDYVPPKPQAKTHTCPDCKRAFSRKGNLMRHMASHDPESKIQIEKRQLQLSRMNRLNITGEEDIEILSQIDDEAEEAEEEYDLGEEEVEPEEQELAEAEEEDDDAEEMEEYISSAIGQADNNPYQVKTVTIKEEDEKELDAGESFDGPQYMVVEVISCDDDNDLSAEGETTQNIKNELDDEFIISELTDEGVNIIKSKKNQQTSKLDNCFGFHESDENIDLVLSGEVESNRDNKNSIQLLEILQ